MEEEDRITELRKHVGKQCEALGSLGLGLRYESEGSALSWTQTRSLFLQYVEFKKYNPGNAKCMVSYMDRFVRERIKSSLDVMKTFKLIKQLKTNEKVTLELAINKLC